MGKRNKIHPIFIAGGVVVIVVALLLFTPAILGATAAGSDLEKYNGSSQQGNDTVRIAGAVDTYLVGLTSIPLVLAAWASALFAVIIVIIWAYRGR